MNFVQHAPALVPVDLLIKLSVHSQDWNVERPANAALKAMVRSMPAVLEVFFERLRSEDSAARIHAAREIAEIARREAGVFDAKRLEKKLSELRSKDKEAGAIVAAVLPKVLYAKRIEGYKYGLFRVTLESPWRINHVTTWIGVPDSRKQAGGPPLRSLSRSV